MAKRRKRKRRKQRIVRHMNVDTSQNIPVTQRFGTIETPERLYSIKHAGSFETGAHKRLNIDTQYKKVRTVLGMAEHALENDCDFHAIAEARAVENREIREKFSYDPWDYAACQPIYDNFSYKKNGNDRTPLRLVPQRTRTTRKRPLYRRRTTPVRLTHLPTATRENRVSTDPCNHTFLRR